MLNTAGLPMPAEPLLLTAGALIGAGKMDLLTTLFVSIIGAVTGDTFSYYIGRWGGRKLIDLYNDCSLCPALAKDRIEIFYKKFGFIAMPVARFILGVRLLSSPLAGALRISYLKFLLIDTIGAAVWTGSYLIAGLVMSNGIIDLIIGVTEKIRHGVAIVFILIVSAYVLFRLYGRWRSGRPDISGFIARLRSTLGRDR